MQYTRVLKTTRADEQNQSRAPHDWIESGRTVPKLFPACVGTTALGTRQALAGRGCHNRTSLMADGVRFLGLEELLLTLDRVVEAWNNDDKLRRLAFPVGRATADFETAIEAGLSGFPTVALHAMRDVMEIGLLLLDFYVDPTRVGSVA